MKSYLTAALLASLAGAATGALAAGPCGADQMVTMRVSKLNAAGTPAGFLDAVKDHKAWYASHGYSDSFVTGPALVPEKGGMKPSASEYVTFHVYGEKKQTVGGSLDAFAAKVGVGGKVAVDHKRVTGEGQPVHDAAWDAYVAKYKANATIDSEQRFCLPKGTSIAAR